MNLFDSTRCLHTSRCTENLEEVIHSLIANILKHTGIVMHVFMGGPDARRNGELSFWE